MIPNAGLVHDLGHIWMISGECSKGALSSPPSLFTTQNQINLLQLLSVKLIKCFPDLNLDGYMFSTAWLHGINGKLCMLVAEDEIDQGLRKVPTLSLEFPFCLKIYIYIQNSDKNAVGNKEKKMLLKLF